MIRPVPTHAGILLLDKPAGLTSAAAVAAVKRLLGRVKVGHLGTLDPFATGLLPLCIGEGTKAAPYLNVADKGYTGVIRLGVTTDTDDLTGTVTGGTPPPPADEIELEELAREFTGEIAQVPPAFSAIKRGGTRMYELARKGQAPVLEPRAVRIDRLVLRPHDPGALALEMECSKGTYVRSLARDIGTRLGCGGALESLRRTRFGPFAVEASIALDELQGPDAAERAAGAIIPVLEALGHIRLVTIDSGEAAGLRQGRQIVLARLAPPRHEGDTVCVARGSELVAIAEEKSGRWRLARVFGG